MAVGVDDYLVADSEDESTFTQLPSVYGLGVLAASCSVEANNLTSSEMIQTAVFRSGEPRTPQQSPQSLMTLANESLFTPPEGGVDSTIDDFTHPTSTLGAPSVAPPKPRPRPRVVMKKAATSDQNANVSSPSFSHISDPPISAMGRTNSSIQPTTVPSFAPSNVIDDVYSSFDIAERAKMRSRKSQRAKTSTHFTYQTNEVIELTSEEDELTLKSTKRQKKQGNPVSELPVQTKSRPKPKLKVKPRAVFPSVSPPNRTMTQDPQMPPAQCMSSHLPPSTLPTIPPSTPPQARELTPLSSPPVTMRKRKRVRPSIAGDDNDMDFIGDRPTRASQFTQPPPFFAPSSSSVPTDSGVEIPPIESLGGRGKKKQGSSNKKRTQAKTQNKGKKGKMTTAADDVVEESTMIALEPVTPAVYHSSSFVEECHSQIVKSSTLRKKTITKKGKARVIESYEGDDEPVSSTKSCTPPASEREGQSSKENLPPGEISPPRRDPPPEHTPISGHQVCGSSVKIKPKLTPMSELIRRVNSQPTSPFPNATQTYSPYLKSSRSMLSRIAPLHPNRRTPPPPMPRLPPPKKSKKQLEMEERIEEELAETIDGWSCLTDEERKTLRKARIDAELGFE